MIFTQASVDDLPAITALESEGFDHAGWSPDAWRGEIEASDRYVVLARDAASLAVVGVATFQCVLETADLHRVVVRGDRRGQGIGRRLVLAGIGWAEAMGAERVLLEVETTNAAALRLYEGLGFRPLARRNDYYGPGAHALVMEFDPTAQPVGSVA